jgi:hypothetical protein
MLDNTGNCALHRMFFISVTCARARSLLKLLQTQQLISVFQKRKPLSSTHTNKDGYFRNQDDQELIPQPRNAHADEPAAQLCFWPPRFISLPFTLSFSLRLSKRSLCKTTSKQNSIQRKSVCSLILFFISDVQPMLNTYKPHYVPPDGGSMFHLNVRKVLPD